MNPHTGLRGSFPEAVREALRALNEADVPYAVVGATALSVRGYPRMTRDLDVVVVVDDAWLALDALLDAGFKSVAPINRDEDPEAMYVLTKGDAEVDLLVASSEPESTIVAEAGHADVFGERAKVASLEHLLLMYLYSNQPRHLGDFARIVTGARADLPWVERYLADVHPEMLSTLRDRVVAARNPPAAAPKPPRRRR